MTAPLLNIKPNTAAPLRERLEWLTDIQIARNGAESRFALRAAPRRSFTVEAILPAAERAVLTNGMEYTLPAYWGWPAGEYELLADAVEAEHYTATGTNALVQIELLLKQNTEVLTPYTTMSAGAYVWPAALSPDGRMTFKESVAWSVNAFDAGHLRSRAVRHKKRTLSALVTLLSTEEIVLFRRFLHALRGRAFPLRLTHPVNGYVANFRLAHDAVELTYLTSSTVTCELRLLEL